MILKLTISIDDVCPKPGNKILGDETEKWLRSLNEEFGCRFDLFIPSNYHQQWPISQHKEWIREIYDIDWLSINAHGHFHQTSDHKQFGECEFFEPMTQSKVDERYDLMITEWLSVGIIPQGFRPPGWLCSKEFNLKINVSSWFKYVAIHYEHNRGMNWNCKTFFGHDGIHQTEIGIHNQDMIMFQSHIAGDWNDNVWNEKNYEQLRMSLEHLCQNHEIEFKLLKECL